VADQALDWAPPEDLTRSVESSEYKAAHRFYRAIRTAVDPILAIPLLIVSLPLLAVIAGLIRVDSPGPALFRQQRIGKDRKAFTIFKFRTLTKHAPEYSLKVAPDSPVVTRLGRFLRRTGLDELPQLWNVLRGDMALIGPRPEQIELIHLYEPWQLQRLVVKPGITGWWQIHHRDEIPLHLNVDKDLYYIANQGPRMDGVIIGRTCRIVLGGIAGALFSLHRADQSVGPGQLHVTDATAEEASS